MSSCNSCPSNGSCSKESSSCGVINNPNNKIKNVIGVMSGKGGVGKSTVSVLIAKRLQKLGYKVGVLDADITGPSIPRLLGVKDQKIAASEEFFFPAETSEGIKVISLNLLVEDENEPVIWRGPVIANTVKQFWTDVLWGELDYLIIDMPPGTGDVALTVMQSIPINGVVMVSIPQDMVSMIVAKAINMAKKMDIDVIGVVQNMSYITCPECNKKISLFSDGEMKELLTDMDVELLGELPMLKSISKLSKGEYESNEIDNIFKDIVENILKNIKVK